ncbi:MAG: sugar ABC transporter ATP-binding protein [Parapedobacter sp.]|nr:MAG: sugar ABC transporter ATP-binding protein [Parapedobacter sp.]
MIAKENSADVLTLEGISKSFPGVQALSDVSLRFHPGAIHAICGENGAGKSTLMKILSGTYRADGGRILLRGKLILIKNPRHAQELGISIVYQERSLANHLTVAENIYVCNQPATRFGFQQTDVLREQAMALLSRLNLPISPEEPVGDLSPGMQQMVEIAKALSHQPDVLILDEPTASITETETRSLFALLERLKQSGVAILYISHRMAEIFEIADVVSVLKDGKLNGTFPIAALTADKLIHHMVGRSLPNRDYEKRDFGRRVLEVRRLSGKGFSDVSLSLRQGEIIGVAGLVGAGRTELACAIFGANPATEGSIAVDGVPLSIMHPADAMRVGIAYLPEERKSQGLFMDMTLEENIVSATLRRLARRGFVKTSAATKATERLMDRLRVKAMGVNQQVGELSGGNQQKIVLAKWLLTNPKVLMVDEPTHGVDVGAKAEIHGLLKSIAKEGCAILLISSELPELLELSDRVLIMRQGILVHEIERQEATEERIMAYAAGNGE